MGRARMAPVDMRYFAARDGRPADYCRQRVSECEIYMAMVGFRYGSLVPGEAISYTEMEFRPPRGGLAPAGVFAGGERPAAGLMADADRRLLKGSGSGCSVPGWWSVPSLS